MSDSLAPAEPKPSPNRPEFEIQVEDGRGLLLLRPRTFFGWLRVEQFELIIPQVQFPLDITGGIGQFKLKPSQLGQATLSADPLALAELVAVRRSQLHAAGFEDVHVELREGFADLSCRARLGESSALLTARARFEFEDGLLRTTLGDAYSYGYLRRPAPLLAHDLLCVLLNAVPRQDDGDPEAPTVVGLADVVLRPLDLFLSRVLRPAGWRQLEINGLRVIGTRWGPERAELRYSSTAPVEAGDAPRASAARHAEQHLLRTLDVHLLRDDLGQAASAYRAELARHPEHGRVLTERLLSVLVARETWMRECGEVAREALARWADFIPARIALASLALARGRDEEAAEQLCEIVDVAEVLADPLVAAHAGLTAAACFRTIDPARAIALCEKVLTRSPGDRRAGELLGELYGSLRRWPQLRKLLQGQLRATTRPRERAAVHLRLGELLFSQLGDPAAARTELSAAAELDDGEPRIFDLWSRVEAALGHLPAAVTALERLAVLLEQRTDRPGWAAAVLRLAQLAEQLGRFDDAERHYQKALELQVGDAEVLEKLAAMEARRGRVPEAIVAYQRLIAATHEREQRRRSAEQELLRLLVGAGRLEEARQALGSMTADPDPASLRAVADLEEGAGRLDEARLLYERAIASMTGVLAAGELVLSLARVLRKLGRGDDELAALERVCTSWPGTQVAERAARRLHELAIARDDQEGEGRWLDALLGWSPPLADAEPLALRRAELFQRAGDAQRAMQVITDRLDGGRTSLAACRLLAEVAAALGDHATGAHALEALSSDPALSPSERALLLCEAVHAHLASGDVSAADTLAQQARSLLPDDPTVRGALGEVAFRQRRWEEVRSIYQSLLPNAAGGELAEWWRRIGLSHEREGRAEEARKSYQSALEVADAEGGALVAVYTRMVELAERQGQHGEAARLLQVAARDERTAEVPITRSELLRHAAEISYRRNGAIKEAIALIEEGLALAPDDLGSLEALELIQVEQGQPSEVAAVLRRKVAVAPDARRKEEWLARLAELELSLGRPDEAREAYRQVLEADPGFRPALKYLAADALKAGDAAAAEALYERLARTGDPEEQRESRLALARFATDAGKLEDAELHLWSAIELSAPADKSALLAQLEALHEQAGDLTKLVLVLAHHANVAAEGPERAALERRRARLLLGPLGDPQAALELCHALALRAPHDPETLTVLAEAARAAGDPGALVEALLALLALTADPQARAELLIEASELYRTRMLDPDRARELSSRLDDLDLPAESRLAIAERIADPIASVELLARASEALTGPARLAALVRLAQHARRADDAAAEEDALESLRAENAMGLGELERLAALKGAHGDYREATELLITALRRHRAELGEGGQPFDAFGRSLLSSLIDAARAAQLPERVAEGLELAASVTVDPIESAELLAELAPVYEQLEAHEPLAGVYEQQLASLSGADRLPLLRKLVVLWGETLGNGERAEPFVRELRALSPAPIAAAPKVNLGALIRSVAPGERAGVSPEQLAQISAARRQHDRAATPAERSVANMRLAHLYRQAGDLRAARSHIESLLAAEPASRAALAVRLELDLAEERWSAAAEALDELQHMVDDPDRRADLLYQQGEIRRLKQGDLEAASGAYLQAIDLHPRHVPTLRRLIDYFWVSDDRENLLDVATTLDAEGGLLADETPLESRARALVAAALANRLPLAQRIAQALGPSAAPVVSQALDEASGAKSVRPAAVAEAKRQLASYFPLI